jgi:hypothetical protein
MARNTLQGKATAGPSSALRSVEKHFQERSAIPQISPLRFAPVEMTKGRVVLPESVATEQKTFFISLGGPKAHDSSEMARTNLKWVFRSNAVPRVRAEALARTSSTYAHRRHAGQVARSTNSR